MRYLKDRKGFTLVELAIVLVIIGIILGAVLKGQTLIQNAKAKRVQSDISGLEAMVWTYFDRNSRFPGDCNRNGIMGRRPPRNTTGSTLSNNTDPTADYCATAATNENNANRAFSDLRAADMAPRSQPNVDFGKHKANGIINIGYGQVGATQYNGIMLYNMPEWMARMVDISIDGTEDGQAGKIRRFDSADAGTAWSGNNNTTVAFVYYFDKSP